MQEKTAERATVAGNSERFSRGNFFLQMVEPMGLFRTL
jgi:hypothetical protein